MKTRLLLVLFCIVLLTQLVLSETEITVVEGNLVKLSVNSEDPDNDNTSLNFTAPLNNYGVWQTFVGDAGIYYVNVSVCDKEVCTSETVKINVFAKKFPPEITSYSPNDLNISINESDSVLFNVGVEDLDSPKLYLSWKLDGKEVSNGLTYEYTSDYYSAGEHVVRFIISDGVLENQVVWHIDVKNVNAPPVLEKIDDITAVEGDLISIKPNASDPDDDKISYTFSKPFEKNGSWQTGFEDEGEYDINVTASDGYLTDSQIVKIKVNNNDRAPFIIESEPKDEKLYVKEGEEIQFSVKAVDPDNDNLNYVWTIDDKEVGDNKSIKYTPDFNSAGIDLVKCAVSDGTIKVSKKWILVIEDVNQPPVLELDDAYEFNESDLVNITPKVSDPDGDNVTLSFSPPLDDNGTWQTDYESSGIYVVNISASDGKLTTSKLIKLSIDNVDVPPIFENFSKIYVDEGTNLSVKLRAYNFNNIETTFSAENLPENSYIEGDTFKWDIGYNVARRHTGPLGRLLKFLTIYDYVFSDSKEFKIKIVAEAGESFTSQELKVVVLNKNRVPVIEAPEKIIAKEGDLVKINYSCYDVDNEGLNIVFSKPFNSKGEWQTGYEDSGEYNASITVGDNLNKTTKNILVVIENKNRKPFIAINDYIKVRAGKKLVLNPQIIDLDKDNITTSYSGWMDSNSILTNESYIGIHTVTITSSDGAETATKDITVEVKPKSLFWFYLKYLFIGLVILVIIIFIISRIEKKRVEKEEEKERLREEKERLGRERFEKVKELMDIK